MKHVMHGNPTTSVVARCVADEQKVREKEKATREDFASAQKEKEKEKGNTTKEKGISLQMIALTSPKAKAKEKGRRATPKPNPKIPLRNLQKVQSPARARVLTDKPITLKIPGRVSPGMTPGGLMNGHGIRVTVGTMMMAGILPKISGQLPTPSHQLKMPLTKQMDSLQIISLEQTVPMLWRIASWSTSTRRKILPNQILALAFLSSTPCWLDNTLNLIHI